MSLFLAVSTATLSTYAEGGSTNTHKGNEFTISVSSYRYEEPALGMSTKGDKFGIGHTGALVLEDDWFIKDDVRFANGSVDYVGSGFQAGVPDWYVEARGLVGRDIQLENAMYSPYVGFGYRYLFNDLRGYSSTGAIGYRRESNYFYMPIGLTHRIKVDDSAVLATTFEYDYFLRGKQVSRLSDTQFPGYADVTNDQHGGFGFRWDVMYTMADLAFGPFFSVWNIEDSVVIQNIGYEPKNATTEFGLSMRLRF